MTTQKLITRQAAKLNPQKMQWTSVKGHCFTLQPVSWMLANRLLNNPKNKPVPPEVVVSYGTPGQEKQAIEVNTQDPTYLRAMGDWKAENQYQAMLYCFGAGLLVDVPGTFSTTQREFYPEATDAELRFFYVTSLIDATEFDELLGAIMGQTGLTEAGIDEAMSSFQRPGQR